MILIYNITIVFGKDVLKITTGPELKLSKKIEKKSGKSRGLQMEEPNFKKAVRKKYWVLSLSLLLFLYIIDMQEA